MNDSDVTARLYTEVEEEKIAAPTHQTLHVILQVAPPVPQLLRAIGSTAPACTQPVGRRGADSSSSSSSCNNKGQSKDKHPAKQMVTLEITQNKARRRSQVTAT